MEESQTMDMDLDSSPPMADFEQRVLQILKGCDHRPPQVWAAELAKCLASFGYGAPSAELGEVLVSHLCFQNNRPSLWKFLDRALSSYTLLSPLHVLALLTSRVLPNRRSQPEAYRLYLELLSRYAFSFDLVGEGASKDMIIKSVDAALLLSQTYKVHMLEYGHVLVFFFYRIVIGLVYATLEDWGLEMTSLDKKNEAVVSVDEINPGRNKNAQWNEHREQIRRMNSFVAIEILGKLTERRKSMILLRLVYINMPEIFNDLLQRVQFLESNTLASSNLKSASQLSARFSANIQKVFHCKYQLNKRQLTGMLIDIGACKLVSSCNPESGQSACWVPFDIYIESAMDGKQLPVKSTIDVLTEATNTLREYNRANWQEAFLALWLSALRLVQRERDPLEGPIPHLEARLCVLLSIVPLAIANVLEDGEKIYSSSIQHAAGIGHMETEYGRRMDENSRGSRKHGLVSSLQVLGHFSGLLCPPASVAGAANRAAAKAASFISNAENTGNKSGGELSIKAGGNMRHLIVEACIARNLVDTSAYFWPGYVSPSLISLADSSPVQKSPWLTFMEGAPLSGSLIDSLIATPASSLAEVEKLYHIALNGSEDEKSAAANILCGASLSHGWNIQEHVVRFVVKLLSPPVPLSYAGQMSHLVDNISMISAVLYGASSIDTVHILSLHGVVPEVAAYLMPLCEVFGSIKPTSCNKSSAYDKSSIHMVFSSAFLFLLRLWKFHKPPLEECIPKRGETEGELTLEYLLLLRNSCISNQPKSESAEPVFVGFYPKLQAWYWQNRYCVASTLSSLGSGDPVHQVANKILSMIYWKMTKSENLSSNSSTPSSSSVCGSPAGEDAYQRPMLPAWEVLEAMPFVLEAILSACAHGRLSPRDLTTGLRDLVDFFPASIGTIISYFSAEITRGIWKSVPMNGMDWPSPASMLPLVVSEVKEILSAAGVDVPNCSPGITSVMLPLPMAALVSLTITFKLDKGLDYIHAVVGPALENCASSCPWPSMPIISSLWAQKIRRWHNFIVVSCTRSVFRQDKQAVAQLLRSCFTSFLGSLYVPSPSLGKQSSVNGLLGSSFATDGVRPVVAPGFLYLRSCRTIHNSHYVNDMIVGLVVEYARELASKCQCAGSARLKSSQASLSLATARTKEVATLGASLLCITGGARLVQELYRQTMPTWLLSVRGDEEAGKASSVSCVMEGYALAYFMVLSGSLVWGVGTKPPPWALAIRGRNVRAHMNFLAGVLEGNISLGCDRAIWEAYVPCLVGLIVSFAPTWIQEVKVETLKKLASGLRGWNEHELALSLLERGGTAAIGCVAELVHVID